MGKFPTGTVTPHVKQSQGADTHPLKFYSTTNETTYGAHWSNTEPRKGKHTGTGYLANFRPGVYYSANLDRMDNPAIGRLVAQNYLSQTHKDMTPYSRPYGTEVLPRSTHQVPSGFINEKALTVPNLAQVKQQFITGRLDASAGDVSPKRRPLLHRLRSRDPTELENCGHGPSAMTSEYFAKYKGKPWASLDLNGKALGPKEQTGFTENHKTMEPITNVPDPTHSGNNPGWMTWRPTGNSLYTHDYRPLHFLHGNEGLPNIRNRSEREGGGFVKGNRAIPEYVQLNPERVYDRACDMPDERLAYLKKNDPAEYLNATRPDKNSTMTIGAYLGQQRPDVSLAARLNRSDTGAKEGTGSTANNDRWVQQRDDPRRFFTHYDAKFYDPTPQGEDRQGHLAFGLDLSTDGFTKSTKTHTFAEAPVAMERLATLDPYQARSTIAREKMPTGTNSMLVCH